uniref:Uncharacterized protein n=1 Tax=Anguilla anguilla TaxID=7936 RepID=A0A0E9Q6W6_ANGAN
MVTFQSLFASIREICHCPRSALFLVPFKRSTKGIKAPKMAAPRRRELLP